MRVQISLIRSERFADLNGIAFTCSFQNVNVSCVLSVISNGKVLMGSAYKGFVQRKMMSRKSLPSSLRRTSCLIMTSKPTIEWESLERF